LAKVNAISQEEMDDAVQAYQAASAAVAAAKATVEQAELNLGFTRIASPINGIAGIARAQIGDLVGPSTGELATVSTLDPIKVYYFVTEQAYINFTRLYSDESTRLERARQFEVELIMADGTVYPRRGQVYAVDRQINPTTGALRVAALFKNPGNALRPGEFARVRVKFDIRRGALLVPQRAVNELQGSFQVVVIGADNQAHFRPVKMGERVGRLWIIEEGVTAGERVVVEGLLKVREGMVVAPQPFAPGK
jgi:membrane fusion protein (multidrug efflux system)